MTIFSQNDKGILQWYYIGGLSDKLRGITVLSLFILLLGAKVSMGVPANDPNSNCGCTAQSEGHPSALSPGKLIHCNDIMKGFEEGQGRVKVIVNLAEPAETKAKTDWHSKQSLKLLQDEIKAIQTPVLSALSEGEFKLRYRFDNQAGFSGEVTLQGLEKLKNDPRVISVEPVYLLEPHLKQGIPLMHADTYRSSYNGEGIAIAICDTGIDYRHPMLGNGGFPNSKVIGGYDYGDSDADPMPDSTQSHGTCCAGIAAGDLGDVGDYIGGVAYNAKLYALKITSGSSGSATSDAMVAAWNWCVTHQNDDPTHPILAISTSFGGGRNYSTCDSYYSSMTTAANNAVAAGITVLASSGNDGYCDSIAWPSCISSVISVGAVYDAGFGTYLPCINAASCATKYSGGCSTGYYAIDNTTADMVTSYSNTASFLTVLSPSNQCYTTDIIGSGGYSSGDYYDSFGGTSAACPYTAGAVACLQSAAKAIRGNYLSPSEVRTILTSTGDNITDGKVAITKPRINLGQAIDYIFYGRPPTANDINVTTLLNTALTIALQATDDGLPNPPGVLSYIITSLPTNGSLRDPGAGGIIAVPYTLAGNGNQVIYTPATDYTGPDNFIFKANDGGVPPDGGDSNLANVSVSVIPPGPAVFLTEGFESAFVSGAPPGWTKSFKTGTVDWTRNVGDSRSGDTAHGGTYNAMLYYAGTGTHETYLISPVINFGTGTTDTTLEFWHKQVRWPPDQDTLKVYYKTSAGGSWILLASYTTNVSTWTKRTIALPSPSSTYYIGFLGNAKYGYGVCIDDVKVTGIVVAPPLRTLTISSTLGGHTEPSAGSHQYSDGTIVGISTIPDPNYHFVNWTGDTSTIGNVNAPVTTITMNANYTVQANFAIDQRTLTVSTTTGGTVIQPGIGSFQYGHGTVVDLNAVPVTGYHFTNWTGSGVTAGKVANPNSASTTITMDGDYVVDATFTQNEYPLAITIVGNGTVSKSPDQPTYHYGDTVQLDANAPVGWTFGGWSGDANGTSDPVTIIVDESPSVTATFTQNEYPLAITIVGNGTVSKSPDQPTYHYGDTVQLDANAPVGWTFGGWSGDANGTSDPVTIIVDESPSVTAIFQILTYTVTASAGANGTVEPTSVVVNYDASQNFNADPNTGYEVDKWTLDGNDVQTGGNTYTLSNVTAVHAVGVMFRELIFKIYGYVLEPDANVPVEGVFIDANNSGGSNTTDANGYYEVVVDYNWSGTVTPSKTGYTFEPNGIDYNNVTTDQNNNYIAILDTFIISGYAVDSKMLTQLEGVLVSPDNDGGPYTSKYYGGGHDTTDVNGYYEVVVDYNWSGKVVPAKYAYAFEPNKMEYVNVKSDSNDQDYIGTLLTFIISGHIKNSCDVLIAGVLVDANNGGGQNTTDVNGFYEVWVDYNWSGTVTPTKGHHTFNPGEMVYVDVLADQTEQNYQALNIYDLDCNGSIGFGDLRIISENWLDGPDLPGDFYKDEGDIVNFLDFAEFAKHWLE
jgi:uncharacterized repeat protein (TIGR02543 family)